MGNETCAQCAGVGKVIIDLKCDSCKGNGKFLSKMECAKCRGTGKLKRAYHSMSASNIQFCSTCSGQSSPDDPCSTCGGTGRMEKTATKFREIKCDHCLGRGQTDKCDDCIGRGTIQTNIDCGKCNGKGKHKKGQ